MIRETTPALTRQPPRLTARPAPGDVTARAANLAQRTCGRVELLPHASPEKTHPLLPRNHEIFVAGHHDPRRTRTDAFKAPTLEGRASKLEGSRMPIRGTERDPWNQRSRLPPRSEEAIVLLIRGSNLGPSKGFDKGPRSTESGIINGTLEARTLEEPTDYVRGQAKCLDRGTPRGGASSPRPLLNEPTLIERGMDVRSNNPLPAQLGIPRVASSSAPSNREREARGKLEISPYLRRKSSERSAHQVETLRECQPLSQGLGGYTRGCASTPPRIPRTREDTKASKAWTNTNLRRIEPHSCEGSGATVGHLQKGYPNLGPKLLGIKAHNNVNLAPQPNKGPPALRILGTRLARGGRPPSSRIFRLVRGSAASREIPTLERVVSVSLEARRARACGSSSSRPRWEQLIMTPLCGQKAGITAPRNHLRPGEDTGQIHSQQPNPASSTVPTTPLTLPPSGAPPSSKATSKEATEARTGCRTQVATLDAASRHQKEGHYPELEGAIPARTVRGMDEQYTQQRTHGLRSSSPSPTLLVNPYYEQYVNRCIAPLLDVRPRGRNQDKTPFILSSHPRAMNRKPSSPLRQRFLSPLLLLLPLLQICLPIAGAARTPPARAGASDTIASLRSCSGYRAIRFLGSVSTRLLAQNCYVFTGVRFTVLETPPPSNDYTVPRLLPARLRRTDCTASTDLPASNLYDYFEQGQSRNIMSSDDIPPAGNGATDAPGRDEQALAERRAARRRLPRDRVGRRLGGAVVSAGSSSRRYYYDSIISFGDSYTDTGNNPVVFAWYNIADTAMRAPYGSSFFGRPTGRNCDGRLPIDFIAEGLGLPLVVPFLAHDVSLRRGANFAVAVATTIDALFYHARGIPSSGSKVPINTTLNVQLDRFQALEPSLCATPQDCKELFGRSLFFVGEFGVNDYHLSLQKLSVPEVRSLIIPHVIDTISKAIEVSLHLVVPGVIPSGCSPQILTLFSDYDSKTGCLKQVNQLGKRHNSLLKAALHDLRARHPHVRIVYADLFGPIMEMIQSPRKFGQYCTAPGTGRYNYNDSVACGDPDATTCTNPSASLHWDGVHLTEAAYRHEHQTEDVAAVKGAKRACRLPCITKGKEAPGRSKMQIAICAILLLLLLLLSSPPSSSSSPVHRQYHSTFSFGDSFADTGNNPAVFAWYSVFDPVMRPPYGSTFFGRPTGRNSDGRLILDLIAKGLELPYVPPYLGPPFAFPSPATGAHFFQGASFAVGAATALDVDFFRERDIPGVHSKFPLNTSLGVQLQWFESMKPSLCRTTGGTLRHHFSFLRKRVREVRSSYVPRVGREISMAIERLINLGATTMVVPGVIPSGCSPPVLAMFPDAGPEEYDPRTGCLKAYNELGRHHNALLQASLDKLRAKHPQATIIYADFFNPVMEMAESSRKFGFREDVLTVCCGGPGRNNFNATVPCGDPATTTCNDPSASLYWDGVHFTEAANRYIAAGWLGSINAGAWRDKFAPDSHRNAQDHQTKPTLPLSVSSTRAPDELQSRIHGRMKAPPFHDYVFQSFSRAVTLGPVLVRPCHRTPSGTLRRNHIMSWRSPCAAAILALLHLASLGSQRYDSIFSFGDSFADTGNKPIAFAMHSVPVTVMRPPYGETFFGGRPTGRTTDGRVILDLLDLGLPLVPPSLLVPHNGSSFFRHGANFAVAGATTLAAEFYHARGIPSGTSKLPINTSLNVQLEWFETLVPSLATSQDCKELFGRSLFFLGEFGVNDYHLSLKKLSVPEVRSLIPHVIETISMAIQRLIVKHGATSLVVPGVIPSGCSPPILTLFADRASPDDYDSRTGCLKQINQLGKRHNSLLKAALHDLRVRHPDVRIIYADFFGPIMEMIESPRKFGPGRYNYNDSVACGDPDATPCTNPSGSLYWDGVHLTEAGYRHVADGWLRSILSSDRGERVHPWITTMTRTRRLPACIDHEKTKHDASSWPEQDADRVGNLRPPPLPVSSPSSSSAVHRRYHSIFSFGDSFADTGNNPAVFAWYSVFDHVMRRPYGETFFGRNSDGRLILDFIVDEAVLVPHNQRYATSLECNEFFRGSLFFVGEFGVNDYHFAFERIKSVREVRSYVPRVVREISIAIERLIELGATTLVVPGVIPSGCSPPVFAMFPDAGPEEHDPCTGCLKAHNELGRHHNALLQASLKTLRAKHRQARIIYADFFSPVMEMVDTTTVPSIRSVWLAIMAAWMKVIELVCCGGPGRNNFNATVLDPSASLYWDGVHFTEAANRYIAAGWLSSIRA
nr:unnamed protein product [Digitaria exilis]